MSKHRKNPNRPEPDYEVGYQKPPEAHRFKPNHKAFGPRRKKRIDFDVMIAEAFTRDITITVNGEQKTMQRIEAAVERLTLQVANNPAKYLKPNLPLIQDAVRSRDKDAGFDENGVDMTAAFRRKIEQLSERYGNEEARLKAIDDADTSGS